MACGGAAPRVRIAALEAYERAVPLRLPFRFGVVTLREVRQVFLRARVAFPDAREVSGWAAELMVPKWFDKDPARSNDENREQLRDSLALACDFHRECAASRTAYEHAQAWTRACRRGELQPDANGLVAGFGPSLVDRAVMDGLCRAFDRSFPRALQENLFAIDLGQALGEASFDTAGFLRTLHLAETIHARHTVGLADALTEAEIGAGARVDDGLPESLEAAVRAYGHRYFICAEDLTTQPGLGLQQDLALASAVGCDHVERNGHHYVNGMVNAPAVEMDAFAAAHPDLYRRSERGIHLRIEAGRISLTSLGCSGFASAALPDPGAMQPMEL